MSEFALGDIADIRQGRYLAKDEMSEQRTAFNAVPVHGANGIIGWTSRPMYEDGVALVTCRGSNSGMVLWADGPLWVSNNAMAIVPHDGQAQLVYYALKNSPPYDVVSGSAQPQITRSALAPRRYAWPDSDQQEGIAAVLSALDDKIALNQRMNETLEAASRALFRDWFVDFGPTRAKAAGASAWLAPALWSLFPNRLGDDDVPEGWQSYTVGDLAEQRTTTVDPGASGDEVFEHYSLPAYDAGRSPALDVGQSIKSNKTLVPADAVLLSKLNPEISRVWLPNDTGTMRQVASTEFLAFVPREPASRNLLFALFRDDTFRQIMEGMVTGTSKSHQRISPPALRSIGAVVGSPEVFAAFNGVVASMLERMLRNRAESRSLAATRDALLPKLMSGEVRVRDAEALVAA